MQFIDWILVTISLGLVLGLTAYTYRFVRSVADFLSAGRCAGRYLLANARGESDAGLANTLSKFEMILVSGFVLNFWEKISLPIVLLVAASGFVFYRFRETRALTLAQFFERRYSRRFRLFMGVLAFVSGILNYGIFPAISSRFFVYFLDLPRSVQIGAMAVPTFAVIMFAYLALTVLTIIVGGQVTLMLTDCVEGLISHVIYIVIVAAVFSVVSWRQVVQVMSSAPPNKSLINPFDAKGVEDFNIWFVLMALLINIYTTMALQNRQGFNSAARTPHESRMGAFLGNWRMYVRLLMLLVLGVCAMTYMRHPDFAQEAVPIHSAISSIPDGYIQKQMTIPIALRYMLPAGIKGLFCAMMVMGLLAGDAGHIHSWGSILVQDVILPLRKKPLSPRGHIRALRLAVCGVAAFAFAFSILFSQTQYIVLWWAITAGIFTGGAGAAIIGGLYWKKGTTAGAWCGAITGSVLAFAGIICTSTLWPVLVGWTTPIISPLGVHLPQRFWLNNQESAFMAACLAAGAYIIVSLWTNRADFDLERMLHRGRYALDLREGSAPISARKKFSMGRLLGFDENFTFWDKCAAGGIFWFTIFLLAVNIGVGIWNAFYGWPTAWWARYWLIIGILMPLGISLGTLIWFGIGGIRDIRDFFQSLSHLKRDATDDGRVQNANAGSDTIATVGVGEELGTRPGR